MAEDGREGLVCAVARKSEIKRRGKLVRGGEVTSEGSTDIHTSACGSFCDAACASQHTAAVLGKMANLERCVSG